MLTRTIENAQKKVEQQNFLIRKRVLEYDDVMNEQRRVVYKYRREILEGRDMSDVAHDELEEVDRAPRRGVHARRDLRGLGPRRARGPRRAALADAASTSPSSTRRQLEPRADHRAADRGRARRLRAAARRSSASELMRYLERQILLQIIDNRWREHLYEMDYLREGIHLRGFAQIDPLVAYKNEGFTMFEELMASIWEEFTRVIFHVEVNIEPAQAEEMFGESREPSARSQYAGGGRRAALGDARGGRSRRGRAGAPAAQPVAARGGGAAGDHGRWRCQPATVVKADHEKIGRNDPCWCGSGKKYKKCHGA